MNPMYKYAALTVVASAGIFALIMPSADPVAEPDAVVQDDEEAAVVVKPATTAPADNDDYWGAQESNDFVFGEPMVGGSTASDDENVDEPPVDPGQSQSFSPPPPARSLAPPPAPGSVQPGPGEVGSVTKPATMGPRG